MSENRQPKQEPQASPGPRLLYPISEARYLLGGISNGMFYKLVGEGLIHLTKIRRRSFVTDDELHRVPARISAHRS